MAFFYPRKQTLFIFVVCLVAVAAVLYYRAPAIKAQIGGQVVSVQPAKSPKPVTISDSDKDGVPDWQEQVSELNSRYDTKAAAKAGGKGNSTVTEKPLTLTDKFGRDFLTQYVGMAQSGMIDDSDTTSVDQTVNTLLANALDADQPVTYKLTDIKETPATDAAALKKWSDSVTQTLDLYTWTENEAMIANQSISHEDPEMLKKIDPIIAGYGKIIANLRATPTPASASLPMVDLINAFSSLHYSARALRSFHTDPLKGMAGIRSYTDGVSQLLSSLDTIDGLLQSRGISMEINSLVVSTAVRY